MPSPLALTSRAKILLAIGLVVLVALSIHRMWFAEVPGPYVSFGGRTMGTSWEVKLSGTRLRPNDIRAAAAAAEQALDEVVDLMSTWEPDSEISRFNAHHSEAPFPVAPETLEVVSAAQAVSRTTGGAFDITVGPLVDAWGFGPEGPPETPPDPERLAAIQQEVGFQRLEVNHPAGTLRKQKPELEIDLSAIAKGYAVDQVARALDGLGHHNYLVEVGGEIRTAGKKNGGRPWRVAIERPSEGDRAIQETLELTDLSMATSGDYRNYYQQGDERISHTVDPRTGRPIRHRLASVSVVDSSAMQADAWATALNVLGPESGYTLAESQGLAAYFILRSESGFSIRATLGMQALLAEKDVSPPKAGEGT